MLVTTMTNCITFFSFSFFNFRGKNQPLVPKMECHHHSGNHTPIFHLPLRRLVPAISLLLHEVRAFEADRFDWLNFSLIEIRREVPTLATVVSCLTESWCTAATNVYAQSPIFCVLYGAIGTGGNGWLLSGYRIRSIWICLIVYRPVGFLIKPS